MKCHRNYSHWFLAVYLWVGQQRACDESFDPVLTAEGLSRVGASSQWQDYETYKILRYLSLVCLSFQVIDNDGHRRRNALAVAGNIANHRQVVAVDGPMGYPFQPGRFHRHQTIP